MLVDSSRVGVAKLTAVLLVFACPNLSEAAEPRTASVALAYQERVPMVLLVLTPQGVAPGASASAFLSALERTLRDSTSLRLRSIEQVGADFQAISECPRLTRMSCWVKSVRLDYGYLLVVAVHPQGDGDLLSALLVDTALASGVLRRAERTTPAWEEAAEREVFGGARVAKSSVVQTRDPEALERYFKDLAEQDFRSAFEGAGPAGRYATVILEHADPAWTLQLDGEMLPIQAHDAPLALRIRAGRRALTVAGPTGTERLDLVLEPGAVSRVEPRGLLAPARSPDRLRPVLLWGGVTSVVAGSVLAAVALAEAPKDLACLQRSAQDRCSAGFVTFVGPSWTPSGASPAGLAVAPLGFALIGFGATSAASALLFDESDSLERWLTVLAGVAGGALVYGLSVQLAR
jgi:hypothetical protein